MRLSCFFLLIIGLVTMSCEIKSQPISYGSDVCHFCSMTIVDKQYGSEVVTKKGRVYKFDSIECLLNHSHQEAESEIALKLCNHYHSPGELIELENATFLISENLPSPMGAFLTAFESETSALKAKEEYGGDIYNWNELVEHWKDRYVYYE